MESKLSNPAHVVAIRLAAMIGEHPLVLVIAPREFEPSALATAAMERLHGVQRFANLSAPEDLEQLADALNTRTPILAHLTTSDPHAIDAMRDWLNERIEGVWPYQVVAVLETDAPPENLDRYPFSLRIDHQDLAATPEEVATIRPEVVADDALLYQALHLTGGALTLLRVPDPASPAYRHEVAESAAPWAERLYHQMLADGLLTAQMWLGRPPDDTFAALAPVLIDWPVTPQALRAARRRSCITAPGRLSPGLPGGRAVALQSLAFRRDRPWATQGRSALASAALANGELRGIDRFHVLATLEDWEALDRLLASKLHLLATLTPGVRRWLGRVIPTTVPRQWAHLAHARRFLDGGMAIGPVPLGTPVNWHEFIFLIRGEAPPPPGSMMAALRQHLARLAQRRSFDLATGRQEVTTLTDLLGDLIHQLEAQDSGASSDDAALLRIVLALIADTAVTVGQISDAHHCLRRAVRLGPAGAEAHNEYPGLTAGALGRSATLAAVAGQPRVAEQRYRLYDEVVAAFGPPDASAVLVAELGRRYPTDAASLADGGPVRTVDPSLPYAALQMEAEGLRALLLHGPSAGAEWLRGTISRASWSDRRDWEWWPLHGLMALAEAREGRAGLALRWLERGTLPPILALVVRASVELAQGNADQALRLADQVTQMDEAVGRWRQIAVGIKLACGAGRPELALERDLLVGSEDWSTRLGSLVAFPAAARALILPLLDAEAAALPGLVVEATATAVARDVKLTPRQLETLAELATGKSLPQIAESMFVGRETVRSTVKAMYRRMGVNDRDAAVQLGRALGLI